MSQNTSSMFSLGCKVRIDGLEGMEGVVTAICVRGTTDKMVIVLTFEVSWFHNGELKTAWLEEWRLLAVGA